MEYPVVIVVPVLVVVTFLCAQSVNVTVEVSSLVDINIDKVYTFASNPLNQKKLQQTITNVKVLDKQTYLDEKDGYSKDTYQVSVEQNFPYLSGINYNFTRTASSEDKVVSTQGYVLGITYTSTQTLTKTASKQTKVEETTLLQLPRILSLLVSSQAKYGHEQRIKKFKEIIETEQK